MKTQSFLQPIVFAVIILAIVIALPVFASEDRDGEREHEYDTPRHEMRKELHDMRRDFHHSLTDDQKDILDQAKDLRESGDLDAARALLESSEITLPMQALRDDMMDRKEDIKASLESGDYQAFLDATADAPVAVTVTEDQFATMVEAYQLHEEGNTFAAKELMHELGLPMLSERGHHKFMHQLTDEQKAVVVQARELA